jgi:predicted ATP-grasp superfamily ATP-dependent carboligase
MTAPIDAVVLGLSPTGLFACRELHRAGRRVLGVDAGPACAAHSSALHACWRVTGDEELLQRLAQLGSRQAAPPVLLPTSDRYIEFVTRHAASLVTHFLFFDCHTGVAGELLDKLSFHRLCQRHGMAAPGVWEVRDKAALQEMAGQIAFPCILKPALIHRARAYLRGKKVVLARTPAELEECLARVPDDVGGWLVQEVIPGAESRITLFAGYASRTGEILQAFTARKLRQYPPGFGSASLAMSETCAETAVLAANFVRAIGLHGIFGAEFKRDPRDGQLKIIEINPRPTLWFQLSHAAGKRIVDAAWRDLRAAAPIPDPPQRDGVLWRYALKDLASVLFYRRHRDDFIFPPPDVSTAGACTVRTWAVYDRSDPLPALVEPLLYLRKWWRERR